MMRSLFSGVSGLTSHQTRMDVIGNNIANVNTYGFKSSRVTFRDIYYQQSKGASAGSATQGGVNPSEVGLGTQVASIEKIMSGGSLAGTSRTLDMAIPNSGFFQVMDPSGQIYYTRAGNFNVDNDNNLVDAMGNFVLGVQNNTPLDSTGVPENAGSSKIKLSVPTVYHWQPAEVKGTLKADGLTGHIQLDGSFDGTVKVTKAAGATADKSTATYIPAAPPDKAKLEITIAEDDYNALKTPKELASTLNSILAANKDTLKTGGYYGGNFSIDTAGKIKAAVPPAVAPTQSEADAQLLKDILDVIDGETATDTTGGKDPAILQNYMDLTSFGVGKDGVLTGVHAIWGPLTFGRVDVAIFNNPEGLLQSSNSYYTDSPASGTAVVNRPGYGGASAIVGATLEMSNVNLSNEFTDMITTQRGFQANSRTITVSDTMLEELINLKR